MSRWWICRWGSSAGDDSSQVDGEEHDTCSACGPGRRPHGSWGGCLRPRRGLPLKRLHRACLHPRTASVVSTTGRVTLAAYFEREAAQGRVMPMSRRCTDPDIQQAMLLELGEVTLHLGPRQHVCGLFCEALQVCHRTGAVRVCCGPRVYGLQDLPAHPGIVGHVHPGRITKRQPARGRTCAAQQGCPYRGACATEPRVRPAGVKVPVGMRASTLISWPMWSRTTQKSPLLTRRPEAGTMRIGAQAA